MKRYIIIKRAIIFTLLIILLSNTPKDAVYAEEIQDIYTEEEETADLSELLREEAVQGLIYLCDYYDIKAEADENSETVISVPSGTTVQLLNVDANEEGLWYYVKTAVDDQEYYGYVLRQNLAISNETVLEWERNLPTTYSRDYVVNAYADDVAQFPKTYQTALYELKEKHPNWVFVRSETGLNWDYVIENEMVDSRSLVGTYRSDNWKSGTYSKNWAYASRAAVQYCMDPRNYLDEEAIFQFEQLTYNSSYHSVEATQKILQNTFMSGIMPGSQGTYAQNFVAIGKELYVSPFHLASRVAQEQGNGTSPLISGCYPGYEGYYNYFNIGASGNTDEAIYQSGLSKAREKGWTSPYLSIQGGAQIIAQNYILKGQDTLYLQKFDVDSSYNGLFYHQYMQNIEAPYSEAKRIAKAYQNAGAFDNTFVFKIPVYQNMPATPCTNPDTVIASAGIYLAEYGGERVTAGLVVETTQETDLEYRWQIYDYATGGWTVEQDWTLNNEWFFWYPPKTGAYLIHGEVRIPGQEESVTSTIGYNHVSEDDIYIKGMCQMPYSGEGGGFLIGVETSKNPDQKLQYELLIMDCTLYAEGKPAWIWSSGKCSVSEGNAFWAIWQPQYGYYFTYFRVFDENGELLDDECYGFENV